MFGQSYNFTVRASNSIGLGEESNTVTVTTHTIGICSFHFESNLIIFSAIPSAPKNLSSTNVTYQSVSLSCMEYSQ